MAAAAAGWHARRPAPPELREARRGRRGAVGGRGPACRSLARRPADRLLRGAEDPRAGPRPGGGAGAARDRGSRYAFWSRTGARSASTARRRFPTGARLPVAGHRRPPGIHVSGAGACWTPDGRIVYSRGNTGLFEVPAEGGEPRVLLEPDRKSGDGHFHGCSLLPGGRGLVFVVYRRAPRRTPSAFSPTAGAAASSRCPARPSPTRPGLPRGTSSSDGRARGATVSGRSPSRSSAWSPPESRSRWSRGGRAERRRRRVPSLHAGADQPRAEPGVGLARGKDRGERDGAARPERGPGPVSRRDAHRGRDERRRAPEHLGDRRRPRHPDEAHPGSATPGVRPSPPTGSRWPSA